MEEAEYLGLVVEVAPIAIVNAQAETLFGYRRDELLHEPVEVLVPERFRRHHPVQRASYFAAPSARPMGAGRCLTRCEPSCMALGAVPPRRRFRGAARGGRIGGGRAPVIMRTARVHEIDRVVGLELGAITNTVAYEVEGDGKPVTLTPTQFKILDVLAAHAGQTLTREQIIERVSADGDVYDRTLDRHVANLRARIEADPANTRAIVTVFGVGYEMVAG